MNDFQGMKVCFISRLFIQDHIAQIIELVGKIPKHIALGGKFSGDIFNRRGIGVFKLLTNVGEMRHIQKLRDWKLSDVLEEKYHYKNNEATEISEFLNLILEVNIEKRASAETMLKHSWLAESGDVTMNR